MIIENSGTSISWPPPKSGRSRFVPRTPSTTDFTVITDPNLNQIVVWWNGKKVLGHYLGGTGPAVVQKTPPVPPGQTAPVITVTELLRHRMSPLPELAPGSLMDER